MTTLLQLQSEISLCAVSLSRSDFVIYVSQTSTSGGRGLVNKVTSQHLWRGSSGGDEVRGETAPLTSVCIKSTLEKI